MENRAKPFGIAHIDLDLAYWAQMARWDAETCAALSLGADPSVPAHEDEAFAKRLALIRNHIEAGRLPHYPAPSAFLAWGKANGVAMPEALLAAVTALGAHDDWRHDLEVARARILELEALLAHKAALPTMQRLYPKEEQSLLKLVYGMAREKFGFDPRIEKTPATRRIVEALARHGIRLDDQTVRNWLRKATEHVEGDNCEPHAR